jgi:CBS domain-containing protein
METQVIYVNAGMRLLEVHRLFVEKEIHGAPVVDEEGSVVGVITATDLLRVVAEEHEPMQAQPAYFRELLLDRSSQWAVGGEDFQDRLSERRAADAMTRVVFTVPADALASEVARVLRENGLHRAFVSEDGKLARGAIRLRSTRDPRGLEGVLISGKTRIPEEGPRGNSVPCPSGGSELRCDRRGSHGSH